MEVAHLQFAVARERWAGTVAVGHLQFKLFMSSTQQSTAELYHTAGLQYQRVRELATCNQ